MPRHAPTGDLVEQLVQAACEAIGNERPELTRAPERLRGITLELRISRAQGSGVPYVSDGVCYVERAIQRPRGERT